MVIVLLADGFEEIEALSVIDVLRRAEINVSLVSTKKNLGVIGRSRISVNADCLIDDIDYQSSEMLVLPGGSPGVQNLETNNRVQEIIKHFKDEEKLIAAICAAPYLLGKSGCLEGLKATCFPGFEKMLKGAKYVNKKVVYDRNILTSKGAGSSLDFSFKIVELLRDKKTSEQLKKSMQYIAK